MMQHYAAAVKYIVNERRLLGDEHPGLSASRHAQMKHFLHSLPMLGNGIMDSATLLIKLMTDPSDAFTDEQRKRIAEALSMYMRGIIAASTTGSGIESRARNTYS